MRVRQQRSVSEWGAGPLLVSVQDSRTGRSPKRLKLLDGIENPLSPVRDGVEERVCDLESLRWISDFLKPSRYRLGQVTSEDMHLVFGVDSSERRLKCRRLC
jgi:hypothetical protein